jgi:hypothetical protein
MIARAPTLRDLFALNANTAGHRDAPEPPPSAAAIAVHLGPFGWNGVYEKVSDLLDVSVGDVLAGGWRSCGEVRRRIAESRLDPSRTVLVHLGTHTITSEHHPSVEIRSEGRRIAELVFPVAVEFAVDAVELTVRGGAVVEARTGDVRARGTVKLEEAVLFERESAPLPLPGKMVFSP